MRASVFEPTQWKSNARAFASWVDKTERAAQQNVKASAESARSSAEQHKQQVKSKREDSLQKLTSEVAQSDTARNLINLLI